MGKIINAFEYPLSIGILNSDFYQIPRTITLRKRCFCGWLSFSLQCSSSRGSTCHTSRHFPQTYHGPEHNWISIHNGPVTKKKLNRVQVYKVKLQFHDSPAVEPLRSWWFKPLNW